MKDFEYVEDQRSILGDDNDRLDDKGGTCVALSAPPSLCYRCSRWSPNELMNHFCQRSTNGGIIDLEMKEFFSRYTNDVIAK